MSSTPFGEHLKREREMRGVSLEEISAATRISTRFLEAIEADQWDQLPGGVFNRGFIRSIARFLGLDADSLVAEYVLGTKGQAAAPADAEPPAEIPRNWRPLIVAIVTLVLLLIAIATAWFLYHRDWGWVTARWHKSSPAAVATPSNGPAPGAPAAPGSTATSSPTAESAAPAADALTLGIEAGKSADIKVIADGKTAFEGHVAAGDAKEFEAQESFEVTTSESSAFLLELNGQTLAPFGTPGQPGSVTLTRNDLRPTGGGGHH